MGLQSHSHTINFAVAPYVQCDIYKLFQSFIPFEKELRFNIAGWHKLSDDKARCAMCVCVDFVNCRPFTVAM